MSYQVEYIHTCAFCRAHRREVLPATYERAEAIDHAQRIAQGAGTWSRVLDPEGAEVARFRWQKGRLVEVAPPTGANEQL